MPVISFTGSTETGSLIGETCGRMHKRLSLEMGGKNAMIVMDDADLDLALEGVLWGAFGTTGQRCTATSRLILHRKIHDRFVAPARRRARRSCGWATAASRHRRRAADPRGGAREGRALRRDRAGARAPSWSPAARGRGGARLGAGLLLPADHLRRRDGRRSRLEQEEIFGPVLSVIRVRIVRRGDPRQQRREVRPLELALHPGREPRVPRDGGARQRHHLRQRARPSAPRRTCRSAA